MYIVLEYLLIENFIINFFILYLTKILVRAEINTKRIVLGAVVASFYSLAFFSAKTMFLTYPFFKLILSAILIRITFGYLNFKIFIKEIIAFYIISFIFAGATLGVFFSSNNISALLERSFDAFNGIQAKYLLLGVIISLIGSSIIFQYYQRNILRDNYIVDLTISYNQKKTTIKALLDTGNSLVVPFTNKRVMVVEYNKLSNMLPNKVKDLLIAYEKNDYHLIEELLNYLHNEISLTLIPFNSIGKSGMIFGFEPDFINIKYLDNEYIVKDAVIGIFLGSLEKEMGYSGLIHYDLINGGIEYEQVEIQN